MKKLITVGCTGHRPTAIGIDYSDDDLAVLTDFAELSLRRLQAKRHIGHGMSGMALGWDTAFALACLRLRIPLIAAVPFTGQERRWPQKSQEQYHELLRKAVEVVTVSPGGYEAAKMLQRNEYMVKRLLKHDGRMLALYNGADDGGTAHCVARCKRWKVRVTNVWDEWIEYRKQHL